MPAFASSTAAMEMAAKYICDHHSGRCPLVIVKFPCPSACGLDTVAWHCWISYFQNLADKARHAAEQGKLSRNDITPANAA